MDKKQMKKWIGISAGVLGAAAAGMALLAKAKQPDSVYADQPEEQNPLEGKQVVFVEDETEPENADGARGHLEAVGDTAYTPSFYDRHVKRALDAVLAFGGLVALSPVFAGIAIAIKLDDPGPVFFTQKRLGRNKQYFKLHKFRSMKMSTPHDVPTHMLENPDQYITRVGRFLRAHSLDELPQIWDIFVGNMSVIGPRPGLWNQDMLTAERDRYHANDVRPGLTGWAQINGRDELELPVKAKLDGDYVRNESLLLDAACFLGTVRKVGHDDSVVEGGPKTLQKDASAQQTPGRKKILIITNHSYMLWQFRRELIQALQQEHEVVLSMPFVGHEDDFAAMGLRCINTEVDRRGINPVTDLKLMKTYHDLIRAEQPDLVITYSIKPNIYAGLACIQLGVPYAVNVQGLGTAFQKEPLASIVSIMYKVSCRNAKTVFFENQGNAKVFADRHIIPEKKITVLPGAGVNLDYYRYAPYPKHDEIRFLYLGRIMKEKGMDELFYAIRKLYEKYGNKVQLDLVGFFEDEYKDAVDQLVADGIAVFHGFQKDPRPFYANADCIVLPSYHEGMSNVLLEAAASGRCIVTSNIPGCREAVDRGKSGLLCKVKDQESLLKAMEKVVNCDKGQLEHIGRNGRNKVKNEFSKDLVVAMTQMAISHI